MCVCLVAHFYFFINKYLSAPYSRNRERRQIDQYTPRVSTGNETLIIKWQSLQQSTPCVLPNKGQKIRPQILFLGLDFVEWGHKASSASYHQENLVKEGVDNFGRKQGL